VDSLDTVAPSSLANHKHKLSFLTPVLRSSITCGASSSFLPALTEAHADESAMNSRCIPTNLLDNLTWAQSYEVDPLLGRGVRVGVIETFLLARYPAWLMANNANMPALSSGKVPIVSLTLSKLSVKALP
jgi:hypothetical protein